MPRHHNHVDQREDDGERKTVTASSRLSKVGGVDGRVVESVTALSDPCEPRGRLGGSIVETLKGLSTLGHTRVDAGNVFESVGDELSHVCEVCLVRM